MRDELFHLNLGSIHELIAQREISVTELVELTLERIQKVNPKINAVIHLLDKTALRLAKEADEKLKTLPVGQTPHRLFGIPFSIKGIFAVQDQPWEVGSVLRKNIRADYTAPAIQRVMNAGAIPIAITNVPEASIWIETDNLVYGKTRNPFDPKKTSGGSSGGEAALIASGGSFFGIGTDFGGSIRIPSSFCGIAGHKPTSRMVPNDGQWPECPGDMGAYLAVGPLTRRSEDLFLILKTLAENPNLKDPYAIDPKKIRVLIPKTTELFLGSPQVSGLLQITRKKLEQAGISVEIWDHPDLRRATEIWFSFVGHAGKNAPKFSEVLGVTQKLNLGEEFISLLKGKPRHSLAPLTLAALEKLSPVIERHQNKLHKVGEKLKQALFDALGDDGVYLTTVFPRTAPKHHHTRLRPMEFGAAGLANVFEMPSSSVPMGLSSDGLPVGAMISARPGNDHLCLAIARQIEVPLTPIMPAAELLTGSILYPDTPQALLTTSERVSTKSTQGNEG